MTGGPSSPTLNQSAAGSSPDSNKNEEAKKSSLSFAEKIEEINDKAMRGPKSELKETQVSEANHQPFAPAPWEKDPADVAADAAPYFTNAILSTDPAQLLMAA